MIHYCDADSDWDTIKANGIVDYAKQLKAEGKSYGEIARELGIPRTTVSNFCLRNNLLRAQFRGNTVHAGSVEKQSVPACKVTVTYAEKPNEAALADALKILMNVR